MFWPLYANLVNYKYFAFHSTRDDYNNICKFCNILEEDQSVLTFYTVLFIYAACILKCK